MTQVSNHPSRSDEDLSSRGLFCIQWGIMHMQTGRNPAGERRDGIVGPFGSPAEVELMGLLEDSAYLDATEEQGSQRLCVFRSAVH